MIVTGARSIELATILAHTTWDWGYASRKGSFASSVVQVGKYFRSSRGRRYNARKHRGPSSTGPKNTVARVIHVQFMKSVRSPIYLWTHFRPFFFNQPFFFAFRTLGNKPFENILGKGEIARNEQFLFFPQCFLPVWITCCHFRKIWNRRLQTPSVWKSLKFVVW